MALRLEGRAHPLETAVRIETATGIGSGTVIDGRADRTIVLTCAHLFRPAKGAYTTPENYRGAIRVELFAMKGSKVEPLETLAATLIDYSVGRDVGLVECKPGRQLRASPLVDADYRGERGDSLVSVGCSGGNDPTLWAHRLRGEIVEPAPKIYAGVVVEPKPVEGRSGGGLFTLNGQLVGVCNFAETDGSAGFYAAPKSIAFVVAKNGIQPLAHPAESADLEVIPGQSGSRPHPKPPEASPQADPPPSPAPIAAAPAVSWIEKLIGFSPQQITIVAVAAAVWRLFRWRNAAPVPMPAHSPSKDVAVKAKPPVSANDLFNQGLDLLTSAVRADQGEQATRKRDEEQAKLRADLIATLAGKLAPTSGPTGTANLPGS